MTRFATKGLALTAALAAALTLAGCGRKGPLDLPPTSSAAPQASVEPAAPDQSGRDPDAMPQAQGAKKSILLDGLLN